MNTRLDNRSVIFTEFVERSEPRLRRALIASYGPLVGREAAVDALGWAWEHWDRLDEMENPIGYLYRVGQTAARRVLADRPQLALDNQLPVDDAELGVDLGPYLARLSEQQRAAVVLVHGYGMSQRHVADVLGLAISTLREHLRRGMDRLRHEMEPER
jgi:RNA polymerase sigma factor (sigma-70 family)